MPHRNDFLHIISRQDAIDSGLKLYMTGNPCRNGHISARYIKCQTCLGCRVDKYARNGEKIRADRKEKYWADPEASRAAGRESHAKHRHVRNLDSSRSHTKNRKRNLESMQKWYKENQDKKIAYQAERRIENPEYDSEYYLKNKEAILARDRKYRADNADAISSRRKEFREKNPNYISEYNDKNRARIRGYLAQRRAAKIQRSFPLTDDQKADMDHIYEQQALLRYLGYDYHVDHVIPLRGEEVSGLHVPWNLQLIPASVNLTKGNKLLAEHAQWVLGTCQTESRS